MKSKIEFIFTLVSILYFPCKGQNQCSIYNEILSDIQNQVTKSKVLTTTPDGGHNPEDPKFIYDSTGNKELLSFYIVKKKQEFNMVSVKYWFSNFLSDTTLSHKFFQNENNDTIVKCNFTFKHKIIEFSDKMKFSLTDYEHKKENERIVTYVPTKVFFSRILISNSTALVFVKSKIGTDKGEVVFGYIFKKINCQWQIDKRSIEVR